MSLRGGWVVEICCLLISACLRCAALANAAGFQFSLTAAGSSVFSMTSGFPVHGNPTLVRESSETWSTSHPTELPDDEPTAAYLSLTVNYCSAAITLARMTTTTFCFCGTFFPPLPVIFFVIEWYGSINKACSPVMVAFKSICRTCWLGV